MGTNTLPSAVDGNVIPASHHNALVEAFLQVIVPRNAAKAPTDLAGQLGNSLYRFARAYCAEYLIGETADNLKIYSPNPDELWIQNDNDDSIRIKNGSIDVVSGGNVILTVTPTGIFNEKVISHNALKTNTKHNTSTFNKNYEADYETMFSSTLSNCIAGKKIKLMFAANYAANPAMDVRIKINGTIVQTLTAFVDSSDYPYITGGPGSIYTDSTTTYKTHYYIYTVPSNGNYTFLVEYRDGVAWNGTYTLEEL